MLLIFLASTIASRELIGHGSSKTCVYKCTLNTENGKLDAAVKVFKASSGDGLQTEDLVALRGLISEAETLRHLRVHQNCVKYYGICTADLRQGELTLVLEYCSNGSLQKFLTTALNSTDNDNTYTNLSTNMNASTDEVHALLLKWCSEIANGLEYLASEGVSRNITLILLLQNVQLGFVLLHRLCTRTLQQGISFLTMISVAKFVILVYHVERKSIKFTLKLVKNLCRGVGCHPSPCESGCSTKKRMCGCMG